MEQEKINKIDPADLAADILSIHHQEKRRYQEEEMRRLRNIPKILSLTLEEDLKIAKELVRICFEGRNNKYPPYNLKYTPAFIPRKNGNVDYSGIVARKFVLEFAIGGLDVADVVVEEETFPERAIIVRTADLDPNSFYDLVPTLRSDAELAIEEDARALATFGFVIKQDNDDHVPEKKETYLHRGISTREFMVLIKLGEHVRIKETYHDKGLLCIEFEEWLPEYNEPKADPLYKRVPIRSGKPSFS